MSVPDRIRRQCLRAHLCILCDEVRILCSVYSHDPSHEKSCLDAYLEVFNIFSGAGKLVSLLCVFSNLSAKTQSGRRVLPLSSLI